MFIASLCSIIFVGLSYFHVYNYWLGVIFLLLYFVYIIIVIWKDNWVREGNFTVNGTESDLMLSPINLDQPTPLNHILQNPTDKQLALNSNNHTDKVDDIDRNDRQAANDMPAISEHDDEDFIHNKASLEIPKPSLYAAELQRRISGTGAMKKESQISIGSVHKSDNSQFKKSIHITNSHGGKTSFVPEENVRLLLISSLSCMH